jgi:hypothetical protein
MDTKQRDEGRVNVFTPRPVYFAECGVKEDNPMKGVKIRGCGLERGMIRTYTSRING